jgi:hypothetical protein
MADAQASLVSVPAAISAPEAEAAKTRPVKHHPGEKSPAVTFIPFVLTAATFLATFVFQIYQNRQQNSFQESQQRAQEDATANSEWRKALEDLTAKDGPSASVGAYEMVSFLGAAKYGDQALAIVPSLLTKIDNPLTFDVILFDINPHINQDNQSQLITIDTILARDLSDLYRTVTHTDTSAKNRSFGAFLQAPDQFIDGSVHADLLNQAWTQTWELDSVSSALSNDWKGVNWPAGHPTPQDQDLSGGVVFLNNDWSGIDFSGAELEGIAFFGKCKIDQKTKLPRSATVNCAHT